MADQLFLRSLDVGDLGFVHGYVVRNRDHLMTFEPVRPDGYFTIDGVRDALVRAREDREADRGYAYGVFDHQDLIGRVNLSNVIRGAAQSCTIGYSIDMRKAGREWTAR